MDRRIGNTVVTLLAVALLAFAVFVAFCHAMESRQGPISVGGFRPDGFRDGLLLFAGYVILQAARVIESKQAAVAEEEPGPAVPPARRRP